MTSLKPVNTGMNKFCGPAVLSILTGKSTDDCAKVISSINGHYTIRGVELKDLIKAAERMGFETKPVTNVYETSLFRTLTSLVNNDGLYIVMITGHFICIEVKDRHIFFCDNHTKEAIPAASSSRLSMQVLACYKVTKSTNQQLFDEIDKINQPLNSIVSSEYLQVANLVAAAKFHKQFCNISDCSVSLTVLRQTACDLRQRIVNNKEAIEASKLINETIWY